MDEIRFLMAGDSALVAEFGNAISPVINARIRAFNIALEQAKLPGILELLPTYRSVMIQYDPMVIGTEALKAKLSAIAKNLDSIAIPPASVVELPVLYGGEMGPDLAFVAEHAGITPDEVIQLHTEPEYLIYMLGFTPGFTYLGGLNEKIHTPRLTQPRVKIPGGSVGIAGSQTGVYPIDSPGGWQLIGRTPVKLYDPNRAEPILPRAGQYIKFRAVDQAEFDEISRQVEAGTYQCVSYPRKEAE